jgi:hypothetical protein
MVLYHFNDVFQGFGLEETKSKEVVLIGPKGIVGDMFQGMGLEESKSKGVFWLRGERHC